MSFERIAEDMLDSIRVRSEIDALAAVWRKKAVGDAERGIRLARLLEALSKHAGLGVPAYEEPPAPVRRLPPPMQDDDKSLTFTPEQARAAREEDARNAQPDPNETFLLAVKKHARRVNVDGATVLRVPLRIVENGVELSVPISVQDDVLMRVGLKGKDIRPHPLQGYFDILV